MYRRWINVSVIALTALLIVVSGALAADNPAKTFQTTIKSADADSETVTLQINSTHDIAAFMRPGEPAEVAIGGTATQHSKGAL